MPIAQADAFLIPLLAGEVGIPMAGMRLLKSLGETTEPLTARVVAYAAAYQRTGPGTGKQVLDVEARLERSKLPVPPRPDTWEGYLRWSDGCVRAVGSVVGPNDPAGALAGLARITGELLRTLATHVAVLSLRALAPEHAALVAEDEHMTESTRVHLDRLEPMAAFPTLPAALAAPIAALAADGRIVGKLDARAALPVRAAGIKMMFEKLGADARALAAAVVATRA